MKTLAVITSISLLALTGCSSMAEYRAEQAQQREANLAAEIALTKAEGEAVLTCSSKPQCEKAFSLAKVYVTQNSNMRVQNSDETVVSTYGPTETYLVGLSATKTPQKGDSATIELNGACGGMFNPNTAGKDDYNYAYCANKLTKIYAGFVPFIQPKLD